MDKLFSSVTRFNPTVNGDLHLGHIYVALVNQALAKPDGRFLVRFDDNQYHWRVKVGREAMAEFARRHLEDLAWLGIEPDGISYQSHWESRVKQFLAASRWQHVVDVTPSPEWNPIIISDPPILSFGLSSYIAAEKVVLDYWEGVTVMVRGLELLSEHSLYLYLCALLGFEPPHCVYVTRLMMLDGRELSDVSKTTGNLKIRDLRERGIEPTVIRDILRGACLLNPEENWELDNLRPAPRLAVDAFK